MKHALSASIVREGNWRVAKCLEVDFASQCETVDETLELGFEPVRPVSTT